MIQSVEIQPERWSIWATQLGGDMLGRAVRVELVDEDVGDQELGRFLPLNGIVFEDLGEGHRVLHILLDGATGPVDHWIDSPKTICVGESGSLIEWFAIEDRRGGKTIVYVEHLPELPSG